MKVRILITLCSLLLPASVFAAYWPTFSYPDKQLLLSLGHLSNSGCGPGEARLISNSLVNLAQFNFDGACPSSWNWVSRSDGTCHQLSDIEFIDYRIMHYPDSNDWDHSVVTAAYGKRATGSVYFEYVMTTPPGELWYCTVLKEGSVSCANDY